MRETIKARIAELVAHVATYALGMGAAVSFMFRFIKNLDYFDSHCSIAGQYPDGLFLEIMLVPALLAVAALLAYGVKFVCHKWFLYERLQEKKRR